MPHCIVLRVSEEIQSMTRRLGAVPSTVQYSNGITLKRLDLCLSLLLRNIRVEHHSAHGYNHAGDVCGRKLGTEKKPAREKHQHCLQVS